MMLLIAVSFAAKANPVDLNRASEVGAKFLNGSTELRVRPNELSLAATYSTANGIAAFRVFNTSNGFVIVAADDRSTPILGYSVEGQFNPNNVPKQMEQYLQSFVEQIQYGQEHQVVPDEAITRQWATVMSYGRLIEHRSTSAVEPLLSDTWNQNCYYNNLCPEDAAGPCSHVYAGSVATSMAQIMHYWGWPATGTGSYSYTPDGYPTQTVDFGSTTYDWSNMPNNLTGSSSSEEINAVATLLWHCGVAVSMTYGYDASTAYSSYITDALVNYFNYANNMSRIYRGNYNANNWLTQIKNSLGIGCPVHYSAQDVNGAGGHAFVCDGYDSNNLLHFNWGWSGNGNGYFALDALNIYGYEYNNSVYAILNIRPSNTCLIDAVPNRTDGGTVSGNGTYYINSSCTLVATPADRFAFNNWTKDGVVVSTNPTYNFTVTENVNLVANFNRVDANEVLIGTNYSTSYYLPLNTDAYYSISQQIYTSGEIGTNGEIDEIAFYYNGNNSSSTTASIDVYLKHTTKSTFESGYDWEELSSDDLFFSGIYSFDGSAGWKQISLDQPFEYNGTDNLLVCINNHTGSYSNYRHWYTYSVGTYRALYSSNWDSEGYYDPYNLTASGSCNSYINRIKLCFRISQETTLVVTPNPLDIGYRPNGAWMRAAQVSIHNLGMGTNITNVSVTNPFFQLNTNSLELPSYIGYNDDFNLEINTTTGEGEITASLNVNYGSQNQQAQFDLSATAYTPTISDVWETAELLTEFPFSASLASAYIPLYNNYRLPPTSLSDGPDAVYKLVFTEDTYLNAHVTDGESGKVALYPEGFDNVGGPDLENNYTKPLISIHEWLTYDNGTYRTNTRNSSGTTTWGYRYMVSDLASYAGTRMTQVGLYSNSNTGGTHTLKIYTGGTNEPETLVLSQDFEMATGLNDYYIIDLDSPIRISGNETIWIVFSAVNHDHYPAATTYNYFDSQYNGCRWYNGSSWTTNTNYGNWKIKSYVTTGDGREMVLGEGDRGLDEEGGNRDLITIGDGGTATNQYLPSYSYYQYSLTQQIYTASEIGGGGSISSIAFYNGGSTKTRFYTIYMVNTDKISFSNNYDWIPVSIDDQVFSGSVTMAADTWTTIDLDTPFIYDGSSNLALIVDDNTGSYSSGMLCRVFTPTYNNCSLRIYSTGTNYDPYNPSSYSGTIMSVKNQIQLNIASVGNGITNMTVTPGTYYLAASSTSDFWTIDIETESVPCPAEAYSPTPANNATNVTPTLTRLRWNFGKRTTEYMLKYGTTTACEDTLVTWTRDLSQTYTLMGLNNNTQYYWKVVERNDGCPEGMEGPTWNFTTILNGPTNLQATNGTNLFVGDSVQLAWTAMADTCIHSYNIYQDNVLIGNSPTNSFVVRDLPYNVGAGYGFKVTGVYRGGESAFSSTLKVYFSGEGSVSGYVYEQDSVTGIPNAHVVFNGRDEFNTTRTFAFVTDSTGYYNGNLYAGTYNIRAVCAGYQSKIKDGSTAIIYDSLTSDINFVMDEKLESVGNVIAQYYPDPDDSSSPYANVYWESSSNQPPYFEDFESGNFNSLDWQLDITYPWQITTINPYQGDFCMKSGNNNAPNTTSSMQITVEIPYDSYISFFRKISSESYGDYGRFYIDDNQKNYWSGTYGWSEYTYYVSAGTHTFKWTYSKNENVNSGDDCFYIDNIRFYVPENRGEAMNRSFQHYRVYRTNFYNNGPFLEDNTILVADEITDTLFIDASWADVERGVYKYGVSKVYQGNRNEEYESPESWLNQNMNNNRNGSQRGIVTIGEGTNTTSSFPIDNYYNYSCTEQIYSADEIGGANTIYSISFYYNYGTAYSANNVTMFMKNVSRSQFATTADYEPLAQCDIVWKGNIAPTASGWYTINLDTPFVYDGTSNLLVAFFDGTSGYPGSSYTYYQTATSEYKALRYYSNSYCPDPYNLELYNGNKYRYQYRNNIQLITSPLIQGNRESIIKWSNAMDKNMYLTNGAVNITVSLNSGDSPEGTSVTFTNLHTGEQQTHPTNNNVVLDASGYYAWDNFRMGDYQVTVALDGYETVIDTVNVWDNTSMNYVLNEILYAQNDLYISRTGWAMWHDHNNSPIPEMAGDCFEYDFDNGSLNGLTFIDANTDGYNWMLASVKYGTGYGHNGSADCLISQSYDNGYLYPNDYVIFPLVNFGINSEFSFYARCQNSNYNEYLYVAVSTTGNTNANDFTMLQSWTLSDDGWTRFTVNLGEYAGQTGYIAVRHYYNYSNYNTVEIDDVVLTNGNRNGDGNRHFENYQVVLTNAQEQVLYTGNTADCYMQLPTEDLVDGEIYHCKVAGVYTTGTGEWIETDWVYQSCDHFAEVDGLDLEMNSENNSLSWTYPNIGNNGANVSTAFACNYSTSGSNPTSWISYSMDNPQNANVLHDNVQVYGGDYCGADGYVHATYSNNYWYKIEPTTGGIVEQGSLGRYFYDCAWDYTTNTMFGVYNNYLYLWDVEFNTTTSIGSLGTNIRVLACDINGQLWGINYNGYLYKIDKTTASVTQVGNTGQYAYSTIQSGGFDHKTGKLYWMNSDYGYLYEVNTVTCQRTLVASSMGYQSSWCIPYDGNLSSPSNTLGAMVYRDDERIGFTYNDHFTDTTATGNHEYGIRVVYDGSANSPYWNTYFTMSCPTTIGGDSFMVSVTANPSQGGTVTGGGSYINGFPCTVTATVNEGYLFANWTENSEVVSNSPEYTFRVGEDHSLVGNFIEYDPHWSVVNNPNYSETTLIGILQFNGIEQNANYYEVGAFCNGECRGRGLLTYNPQLGRSLIVMTVCGNNNDQIIFDVYDHLQGETTDLVCLTELNFVANTLVGSYASPFSINFGITQATTMQEGWNWYSTFIEQEGIDGLGMLESSLGSDGIMIKSQQDGFVINYQNIWAGSLNGISNEQMYMINTNAPATATIIGNSVDRTAHAITLYPGWTWIGYPCGEAQSIGDALAGFTPTEGDIMKSQQSFASYIEGQGWIGSFNTLEPGRGYMYNSLNNKMVTLTYSETSGRIEMVPNITSENNHWVPNAFEYPYNMSLMAIVMLNDMELASDQYELAAFADGHCIGSSRLMYYAPLNSYMAFLTIYGEDTVDIQFGIYDAESGTEYYSANETLTFGINSVIGSLTEPFVVHFDGTTNISQNLGTSLLLYPNPVSRGEESRIGLFANEMGEATVEIINALGSVMSVETVHQLPISITAPNMAGVYTVRITVEGQGSYCRKLIVK